MLTRRELMKTAIMGTAALGLSPTLLADETKEFSRPEGFKGTVKQSVSKWCFGSIPLKEFCEVCKSMGMVGVDLISPDDWELVGLCGMTVTMGSLPGVSITDGLNRLENHDKLVDIFEKYIPMAAELNVPNVICMSGNRAGLDDETGLKNCVTGLKRIAPIAEKHGVNVMMELLNSKDHEDYQNDHTAWGAEVCYGVGSERIKLLYDIYHMQRMDGDLIWNIRKYQDVIGHYHTGGCPGRNDIDETQEIFYPTVVKAIMETGYKGFIAHEFIPKNGLESLYRAVQICDV
ncbi:MAG: TIM barrel protein [Planctomycetia bacterium]|nr:TIM barrel protein [Planctomycetia bacterium]